MTNNTFTYSFDYTVNNVPFTVTEANCDVFQADEYAGFVQKGFDNFAGFEFGKTQMFTTYMNTVCAKNGWNNTGFNPFN